MYLLNAFSLNMLEIAGPVEISIYPKTLEWVRERLRNGFTSAIGHESTAKVLKNMLGVSVPVNRVTVKLKHYDDAIVAQYIGPRLPEGATELPEGAEIRFYLVRV